MARTVVRDGGTHVPFVRPSSFCSVAAASTGAVVHCTCTCCTCTCTQQGRNETKGTCWVVSFSICLLASLGSPPVPAHPTRPRQPKAPNPTPAHRLQPATYKTSWWLGLSSTSGSGSGWPPNRLVRHLPLPPPTQAKLNSLHSLLRHHRIERDRDRLAREWRGCWPG